MEKQTKRFNWESLLLGLLSIAVGIIALRNPSTTLSSIVIICGGLAIAYGVLTFIFNFKARKATGQGHIFELIISVLEVILGIYLLFNIRLGLLALPIVFAIWFLIDSIKDAIFIRFLKLINRSLYYFLFTLSVIRIVIGVLLIYNPLASVLLTVYLVGVYFILTGIKSLLLAFYHN